jgi:hypothetical protein
MTDDARNQKLTRDDVDDLAAELLPERTQLSVIWHSPPAPTAVDVIPPDPEHGTVPAEPDAQ